MKLRFTVQTKIQKPVGEVFEAVYNPENLSGYFATGGSSGSLNGGAQVTWRFNDAGAESEKIPVTVIEVIKNGLIRFQWATSEGAHDPKTGTMTLPGG